MEDWCMKIAIFRENNKKSAVFHKKNHGVKIQFVAFHENVHIILDVD